MKLPLLGRGHLRAFLVALVMLGCTSQAGCSANEREPRSRDEEIPDPVCDPLPQKRPPGVVLRAGRVDGESLTHVLDVALVAEAKCPTRLTLEDPACVRLADDAMDYVWKKLVAAEPHEIVIERHGECIHCGGPYFTIEWPNGRCERGMGHFHDIARKSWDRFDSAMSILEAAAAAGGVTPKDPPR